MREAVKPAALKRVIHKLVEAAEAGDVQACRVLLDRVLGRAREVAEPFTLELPPLRSASDIAAASVAVVEALASGTVLPSAAAPLLGALDTARKAIELAEIEVRLDALEVRVGTKVDAS